MIKLPKSLLEEQEITGNKSVSNFLLPSCHREEGKQLGGLGIALLAHGHEGKRAPEAEVQAGVSL